MSHRDRDLLAAGAELNAALRDGRVGPDQRADWEKRCTEDPSATLSAMQALPRGPRFAPSVGFFEQTTPELPDLPPPRVRFQDGQEAEFPAGVSLPPEAAANIDATMAPFMEELRALGRLPYLAKLDAETTSRLEKDLRWILAQYEDRQARTAPLPEKDYREETESLTRLAKLVPPPAGPELLERLLEGAREAQRQGTEAVDLGHRVARGGAAGNATAYGSAAEREQLRRLASEACRAAWVAHKEWTWSELCRQISSELRRLTALPLTTFEAGTPAATLSRLLLTTGKKEISYKTVGRLFPNPNKIRK